MRIFLNSECFIKRESLACLYDKAYFLKYKGYSETDLGRKLNQFRRAYVECFAHKGKILDYGTGYGNLVMNDQMGLWRGYDINECSEQRLGPLFDSKLEAYKNVCFFDVLEHLERPDEFIHSIKSGVRLFITIPLWGGNWDELTNLEKWKHWRPGEHFLYASPKGFKDMMNFYEYKLIDENQIETSLGREDVYTFVFEKR